MKKILALALALMLCLCSVAFADETAGETTAKIAGSAPATYQEVIKTYTVTGNTSSDIYPTETLKFTSEAATTNPDGGVANLTIEDLIVSGATNQKLTIKVPSFTEVGTYHFTISETAGSAQGVTYTTGTIAVSVLVTYDYEDADKDGYTMSAVVGITLPEGEGAAKNSTLTNTYDLGSLAVSKVVTGNLGDTSKEFNVTVTFTAVTGKTVESVISYEDDGEKKTIAEGWTGSQEVRIDLKDGETVTFIDIPAGVTYTVVEDDYTQGEKNGENGYDEAKYEWSDDGKAIAKSDKDTVEITNNKETNVDTGIALDNAPYMIVLALVVVAGVMMMKKRSYNA